MAIVARSWRDFNNHFAKKGDAYSSARSTLYLAAMLFLRNPFMPIRRLLRPIEPNRVECEIYDIGIERMLIVTLDWDAISSDDGAILAKAVLDHTSYDPSSHEFRWWVDENIGRYR